MKGTSKNPLRVDGGHPYKQHRHTWLAPRHFYTCRIRMHETLANILSTLVKEMLSKCVWGMCRTGTQVPSSLRDENEHLGVLYICAVTTEFIGRYKQKETQGHLFKMTQASMTRAA